MFRAVFLPPFYIVCTLTNPNAVPISAKGSKRTAPPANIKPQMRAGRAIINKITAIIFVMPQVILNVSLTALKKSRINKTVIAISKIVSNIIISPFRLLPEHFSRLRSFLNHF